MSSAAAMAVAVAVVAMLVVAATAEECRGVNSGQVIGSCMSYCQSRNNVQRCCSALKGADMGCLCRTYWGRLQGSNYASCAQDIQSQCGLQKC